MHWERQEEEDSDLREGSAFSESMEIMQQSRHSLSLVTQDLAIPDLKDPDLVGDLPSWYKIDKT